MSLIKNTTWSAFSAIVMSAGRFVLAMILARKLGVEDFGRFAFFQWLMDMTVMFCALGLPGTATRYFAEFAAHPGRQRIFEKWFFLRGLGLLAVVVFVFPLVVLAFGHDLPVLTLLYQAGWAVAGMMLALLTARAQGLMRFRRLATSNAIYVVVALSGCVLLPEQGDTFSYVILVMMVAALLAALALWSPLPGAMALDESVLPEAIRDSIKKYSVNIWIAALVSALVWSRSEIALVESMLGSQNLALYSVAISLAGLATQGLMLLTGALAPHLTQMWGAGKRNEVYALCRFLTNLLTLAAVILSAFLFLFGKELVFYAFGAQYQGAEHTLSILGLGTFGLASAGANQLLQIKTDGVYGRNLNFLGALSLFGLAVPLIMVWGVEGAAIARAFTQIGIGLVTFYLTARIISPDAVNWVVQRKSFFLITILIIVQNLGSTSLYLRGMQFAIFSLLAMVVLVEKEDRAKFQFLISRFRRQGE